MDRYKPIAIDGHHDCSDCSGSMEFDDMWGEYYLASEVDARIEEIAADRLTYALELDLQRKRVAELEKYERDYKRLATAINLQPGECLPECDSYGHAEKCTYANDAENFMQMTERLAVLETLLRRVIEWEPAVPVEASLSDEIAEALKLPEPKCGHGVSRHDFCPDCLADRSAN